MLNQSSSLWFEISMLLFVSDMAILEETRKIIFKELEQIKAKTADFQTTLNELENSYQFLSLKYNKVLSQTQSESGRQRRFESRLAG